MKKVLPNFLTLLRIVAVPFFVWAYLRNYHLVGLLLFLGASLTDFLDGYLARKWKVISNFGKIADPLADKFIVAAALFVLWLLLGYIDGFVVVVILLREIAVTVLRNYYARKNIFIAANIWGKLKTVTQMAGTIFALGLNIIHPHDTYVQAIRYYFWGVGLITVLSGINYFLPKKAA